MKRKIKRNSNNRKPSLLNAINKASFESGIVAKEDGMMKNGLGEAIGFCGSSWGWAQNWVNGFPGGQGNNPWAPQVQQINVIAENMRWYLVSNFWQQLSQAYAEFGLVQTVVDVPVDDALRGGIEIQSNELDEDDIEELLLRMDRENDLTVAGQGMKWTRLYGGGGIIIIVGDQDPEDPLDIASIKKDTEIEFRAVDMWELFWDQQNTTGFNPELQSTDFEFFNYYAEKLHKSRVMVMKGIEAPAFLRPRLRGWGFSEVEALIRSINQYLKATDVSFAVLDEFKVDYYMIKNLVNTLLSPNGQQQVAQRIQMANWQKNYQNAVILDSEDKWETRQLNFGGLAETMEGIRMQVAADMRMPITKLFGTSASKGLGNTDQNDMENYNSMVESRVRNKLKYHLLTLAEIRCQQIFGFVPDDLRINFKPLRVLSAEQEENVKNAKFSRLLQLRQAGEITSKDLRDGINKASLLPITLDPDEIYNPTEFDQPQVGDGISQANRPQSRSLLLPKSQYKYIENSVQNPGKVDEALWAKAKAACEKEYGKVKWPVVTKIYKSMGGKFE